MEYANMTPQQLQAEYDAVSARFQELKETGLKLDMSRGKPGKAQLDMVSDLLSALTDPADCIVDGMDVRNYGELSGLPCAKAYFAEILGCKSEECFIGGNASLNLMYDTIAKAYTHGLLHSEKPWAKLDKVKFLCPSPGYDRHFKISESFGMEMITIPMTADGPDMDAVEQAIQDPAVKGMWCVPKYSCIHEFDGDFVPFPDILSLCREAGNPDMVFEYASTSKVTFPGAGISVMATSVDNMKYMTGLMSIQTISYDKVNQLRHVRFLKDKAHTLELMKKHAAIMKPKFDAVLEALDAEIAPLGIAQWKRPKGGYFISVDTMDGLAKRTLALCKEAGVVMTGAGATFPYGVDPRDRNIRIAPSLPPVEELETAIQVFCTCLRLAALEKLMA